MHGDRARSRVTAIGPTRVHIRNQHLSCNVHFSPFFAPVTSQKNAVM